MYYCLKRRGIAIDKDRILSADDCMIEKPHYIGNLNNRHLQNHHKQFLEIQ